MIYKQTKNFVLTQIYGFYSKKLYYHPFYNH